MKSLTYLNTHGQLAISATDSRPAGVVFDRVAPLQALDQIQTVTTTSVSVDPGIEILDIIQGSAANVRYQVKIVTGGSSPILSSTIAFPTLPSGVSQTLVGSTYTLSGIDTVAKWNTVKSFTWNLASNYASCQLWFLEISILYYDGASDTNKTVSWLAYDEAHYWVSEMTSTATLTATGLKAKRVAADITSSSTVSCNAQKIKGLTPTNLSSSFSMTAIGTVMVAVLTANASLTIHPRYDFKGRATLSSAATMSITPTYVYSDDLRIQIYYDSSRPTFEATVQTYNTDLVVYWGDGTSTSYTGTGTYRNHAISKTFTGSGYRDIKFVSSAVTKFYPTRGTGKCYVYKIYHWSRVPTVGATTYFSDYEYYNQIYLDEVPDYLPTNVTQMNGTFVGCTSLNHSNISSWNTSSMTILLSVFDGCTSLNQPVSTWNVSNCSNLSNLFANCTSFNQVISWTFKNGANLTGMLLNCSGYNQDLGSITLGGTSIQLDLFISGCTSFSNINYNKFLIRLAQEVSRLGDYPRLVTLNVPNRTETSTTYGSGSYNSGTSAYSYLTTSPRSWTIVKDGITISASSISVTEGSTATVTLTYATTSYSFNTVTVNLTFGGTANGASSNTLSTTDYQYYFYSDSGLTTQITSLDFTTSDTTKNVYIRTYNSTNTHPKTAIVQLACSDPNIVSLTNGTVTITGTP